MSPSLKQEFYVPVDFICSAPQSSEFDHDSAGNGCISSILTHTSAHLNILELRVDLAADDVLK